MVFQRKDYWQLGLVNIMKQRIKRKGQSNRNTDESRQQKRNTNKEKDRHRDRRLIATTWLLF